MMNGNERLKKKFPPNQKAQEGGNENNNKTGPAIFKARETMGCLA